MGEKNNPPAPGRPTEAALPPLRSGAELERAAERPQHDLAARWLDASLDYPEPHYLLEYRGVPFAPLGGIQAIGGQKKNGKTFLMTQLMAAILADGSGMTGEMLPGLRLHAPTASALATAPTVLYCDTEMEQLNTAKVLRRVHWLCGWDTKRPNARFRVLWLRTVDSNRERLEMVLQAIEECRPTAVFLDGVRDVIGNFNDNEESANLVNLLMKTAHMYGCCIWNVLHYNPKAAGDASEEGKMRGHLGTELGNKVTDTFCCSKKKTQSGVFFTVKQQDARAKDVEDWTFQVTDEAGALGVPRITGDKVETIDKGLSVEEVRQMLIDGRDAVTWPATGAEVRRAIFQVIGGIGNIRRQQDALDMAKNRRFLLEQSKDEYEPGQKHPKLKYNDELIMPF